MSPLQDGPGSDSRYDNEYKRCGVCNVIIAVVPLVGKRLVEITNGRTKQDWAAFLEVIAAQYSSAEKIILVMDNLNTHTPGSLYETDPPEEAKALWDPSEFVHTPKHGSWLNMAEIELNVLGCQCLNRRSDSIEVVRSEAAAWAEHRMDADASINWQFKTEDARTKLKRLYPTIDV